MERGDQITIRKELNPLGVVLTSILAGDIVYSPMAVGSAMLAVGLVPPATLVLGTVGIGAIGTIIAYSSFMSPMRRLVMRKLSTGEIYYEHHGILHSSNMVIHEPGQLLSTGSRIGLTHLAAFKSNLVFGLPLFKEEHEITISKRGPSQFSRSEIARRARMMLNREIHDPAKPDVVGYDLIDRNCEHFAYWCRTGEWRSFQIEDNLSS